MYAITCTFAILGLGRLHVCVVLYMMPEIYNSYVKVDASGLGRKQIMVETRISSLTEI